MSTVSDTPIFDQLCAELLFTPDPPAPTSSVEWFTDRTDPQATGLMPAVHMIKPSPNPRETP